MYAFQNALEQASILLFFKSTIVTRKINTMFSIRFEMEYIYTLYSTCVHFIISIYFDILYTSFPLS